MQTVLARISKITWTSSDEDDLSTKQDISSKKDLPTETDIMINVSDPDDDDDVIETIKRELFDKYDTHADDVDYWIDDDFCEDDCESEEDLELLHETED